MAVAAAAMPRTAAAAAACSSSPMQRTALGTTHHTLQAVSMVLVLLLLICALPYAGAPKAAPSAATQKHYVETDGVKKRQSITCGDHDDAAHVAGGSRTATAVAAEQLLSWLQGHLDSGCPRTAAGLPSLAATFELRTPAAAGARGPGPGRGLYARRRIERGEVVAMLPLSVLVSERNYSGLSAVAAAAPRGASGGARSDMAVFLARHRAMRASSPLAAYLALLPAKHSYRPRDWAPELFERHLRGSHFPAFVAEKSARVLADWRGLDPTSRSGISLEAYVWARDIVTTRAMAGNAEAGLDESVLFPLMDMGNHADDRNVFVVLKGVDDGDAAPSGNGGSTSASTVVLQMIAARLIRAGDEILNGYMDFGNTSAWTSLEAWGFVTARTSAAHKITRLHVSSAEAFAVSQPASQCARVHTHLGSCCKGATTETRRISSCSARGE